jgi:hypothetical protein
MDSGIAGRTRPPCTRYGRLIPHTWKAFRLTALEGQSGATAAAHLGKKAASLFAAKRKVQKSLQDEVRQFQ